MIFENPDDLGYFTDQEMAKSKRNRVTSSLVICNNLLSRDEREAIMLAAINAQHGHEYGAESYRRDAGYGGLR